jgi:hypothetical protein
MALRLSRRANSITHTRENELSGFISVHYCAILFYLVGLFLRVLHIKLFVVEIKINIHAENLLTSILSAALINSAFLEHAMPQN